MYWNLFLSEDPSLIWFMVIVVAGTSIGAVTVAGPSLLSARRFLGKPNSTRPRAPGVYEIP